MLGEATGASSESDGFGDGPLISVVVATPDGPGRIQKLVRHLVAQTLAPRIELVVVAPTARLGRGEQSLRGGLLGRVVIVPVGPIDDVDRSLAAGVRAASAPVVALVEDHAYPEPDWAAALVEAHRGSWAAVGAAFRNANPGSSLSWANMLIAYGAWVGRNTAGQVPVISRHNSSFKRRILDEYGAELEERIVRGGGMLDDLTRRGETLYFEPRAWIAHVNPSRIRSTLRLRFDAGRLEAARRAEHGRWSASRRAAYVAGSPLFPVLRLVKLGRSATPRCEPGWPGWAQVAPALGLALVADAIGQATGFARGAGGATSRLRTFELDRWSQVRLADRAILSS